MSRKYYYKLRKAGLCVNCSKFANGKARCSQCSKKETDKRRQLRQLKLEKGICQDCKRKVLPTNKRFCKKHAKIISLRRKRPYNQDKLRIYHRRYRESLIRRNKCLRCRQSMPSHDLNDKVWTIKLYCPICYPKILQSKNERNRRKENKEQLRIKRKLQVMRGHCRDCNSKREQENRSFCNKCLDKRKIYERKARKEKATTERSTTIV